MLVGNADEESGWKSAYEDVSAFSEDVNASARVREHPKNIMVIGSPRVHIAGAAAHLQSLKKSPPMLLQVAQHAPGTKSHKTFFPA